MLSLVTNDTTFTLYTNLNSLNIITIGADLDVSNLTIIGGINNSASFTYYGASIVKNYAFATFSALIGNVSSVSPAMRVENGGIDIGPTSANSFWYYEKDAKGKLNPAAKLIEPLFNTSNGQCAPKTQVSRTQFIQDLFINMVSQNVITGVNFSSGWPLDTTGNKYFAARKGVKLI